MERDTSMTNVSPDSSILATHVLEVFGSCRETVDSEGNSYSRLLPTDVNHSFTELMEN